MADALTMAHRAIREAHKAVHQAARENGWLYGLDDADKLLQDAMTQVRAEIDNRDAGEQPRLVAYQV